MSLRDVRVMIIDDNAHMQEIFRTLLQSFGVHDIVDVRDAETAFTTIREWQPHIAIVDINLGTLDGIEFTKLLRTSEDSPNPYLPIIICSAHAEKSRIIAARNAGAMEFVCKPISAKALYSRLIHVLDKPRPFVRTKTYFGPCRRRRFDEEYEGPRRREDDEGADTAQDADNAA